MGEWSGNIPNPLDDKHFEQFAENSVRTLRDAGARPARMIGPRARRSLKQIRDVHSRASAFSEGGGYLPGAAEWLLDNWYLAQREGKESLRALRGAGRVLCVRDREGVTPRVYALAAALLRAEENAVSERRVVLFLERVQAVGPLSERELSLFLPMLRLALAASVAALCDRLDDMLRRTEQGDPSRDCFAAARALRRARESGAAFSQAQELLAAKAEEEFDALSKGMERAFTSLRTLATANLTDALESVSQVERILRQDPAGIYEQMDDGTRAQYRHEAAALARRRRLSESEVAQRAVELAGQAAGEARHVGFWLFKKPLGAARRPRSGMLYVGGIVLASLFFSLLAGFLLHNWLLMLLLAVPVSDIVKNTVDFLVVHTVRPRPVPRLALEGGAPPAGRTLCVISALLPDEKEGAALADRLEHYRIANRDAGDELLFGILADLPDSLRPMGAAERRRVEAARAAIAALNAKTGGGFYLFFRTPVFNDRDERYMGWERKRGALLELMRLLRGRRTGMRVEEGDAAALGGVRYLITLDSDTRLNIGAARELIGAMLHPLNRPQIDKRRRVVTSGYGLLQPRISVDLEVAGKTRFSRIFAGQGGVDPYGSASSDVYHDLFNSGTYTGKGILDVDAFLTCLDGRFPDNTVLSHDLLEGAYLHAGLIGDVELTDGYPTRAVAYFARLHRWVRGDWQISSWLRRAVPDPAGGVSQNPIDPISRWKIFDNLRRSLVPVFTLPALVLGMLFSGRIFAVAAGVAIFCALSNLLLSGAEIAARRGGGLRERYHSTIVAGFGGVVLQTLVQLVLLPCQAWICLSATTTALWRMRISKRNLLAWVTAAAAEQGSKNTVVSYHRALLSAPLVGLVAMVFFRYPAGFAVGAVWFLAPLLAFYLSRPHENARPLPQGDRAFLLHEAVLIWRYFDEFLRPEDHYLPPDNFQEQPAVGLARRTSPTNIGMALLCCLTAADLDLTARARAVGLIGHMLDTLERLPKWNGHLYNWYDTATARPLRPRYVSTVDSGNLCACLITLREGLRESGDPYEASLAARAGALADRISFRPLYDPERRLFRIGIDLETGAPTEGWYDLLASEARQSSYIAIARGEVEAKHWRRLGRSLVSENDYRGMASWTGTMFEYFMPNLTMPLCPNSLIYESLCFCVYVQRRHTASRGLPWGVSESAFYAFDSALNYQYKAHGVQRLGLKRGLDTELVVSPYSSFLALCVAPGRAVRNLRRIRSLGLEGRFGLYEAVDFTPGRQTGGRGFEAVRTYMAHHLGMSLVAINNALREDVMQRRFMADGAMAAYRSLLQEKVPVGAVVMKSPLREVPERLRHSAGELWQRAGEGYDPWRPNCHLLSNGSYHVLMTDTGLTRSLCGGLAVTRFQAEPLGSRPGIRFFLRRGEGAVSLTPAPGFDPAVGYGWRFDGGTGCITARSAQWEAQTQVRVPEEEEGELREIRLRNRGGTPLEGELCCYFEPVLQRAADFEAHPAFSKLSLFTRSEPGGVLITRRTQEEGGRVCAAFLCDDLSARFETSRAALARRDPSCAGADSPSPGGFGTMLEPCVLCRVPVSLAPGEETAVRFSLAVSGRQGDAFQAAERILRLPRARGLGRLDGCIRQLGLTRREAGEAFSLLREMVFPSRRGQEDYTEGQAGLWRYGISGDLPILAARIPGGEGIQRGLTLLREQRLLAMNGFSCDLALLTDEGGDYRRPVRGALGEGLRLLGMENLLGARGGVHITTGADAEQTVLACAEIRADEPAEAESDCRTPRPIPVPGEPHRNGPAAPVSWNWREDGSFRFRVDGALPPTAWSHVLANDDFGTIVTEAGPVHLWCRNTRENRITRWRNDPLLWEGEEHWAVRDRGRSLSLFAAQDAPPCSVSWEFGAAVWEREWDGLCVRTTAFVPPDLPARVFLIEITGGKAPALRCCIPLLLGAEESHARHVVTSARDGVLEAWNPYHTEYAAQRVIFAAGSAPEGFTCDRASFSADVWDGKTGTAVPACFAARWVGAGTFSIVLGSAGDEAQRAKLLALTDPQRAADCLSRTRAWWRERVCALTVRTPDELLNRYLNGWGLYQTLACRIMARCSLYQCGGAYGFRDQLQDVCALLSTDPGRARAQLLRAAARQYEEGDVQHWWHPAGDGQGEGKGVRTRYTDDLLWLPYALCAYVDATGDMEVLRIEAPWLTSAPLEEGEQERYEHARAADRTDTLLTHALRAASLVLARGTGSHGLALFGGGDWNDGMNRVGIGGRGESVWLSWFAAHVFECLAALCREADAEASTAEALRAAAQDWTAAANGAWAEDRFLRGWFDDGRPLGAPGGDVCAVDSVAQSFAALWGQGEPEKTATALQTALHLLFDRENRVVRLLTPPFDGEKTHPGYIAQYPPGIRENGGQYTHAAVWLGLALLRTGQIEDGYAVLRAILPSERDPAVYAVEPYVLSADIYSHPQHVGRGGWSWYTGAAGWYVRAAWEDLLGLRLRRGKLRVSPRMPEEWNGYEAVWRTASGTLRITVRRGGAAALLLDGAPVDEVALHALEGTHTLEVTVAAQTRRAD